MARQSQEGLRLPNPWAAVGRDTAAGRALFALYNGFGQARDRGNDYSDQNKIKILKQIAAHGAPEFPVMNAVLPKKPNVKVPHFYKKPWYYQEISPVELMRGRRKASQILNQLRADSYVVDVPPMPKGPLLDDREKCRLQEVFYWSNRNIGPDPKEEVAPVRRPRKGSIEEQELLLSTIAKEVEDRKTFLKEMETYGRGDQYRLMIHKEIQDRIKQMVLLHDLITEGENKILQKQTKEAIMCSTNSKLNSGKGEHGDVVSSSNASQHGDHQERYNYSNCNQQGGPETPNLTSQPENTERSYNCTNGLEAMENLYKDSPCDGTSRSSTSSTIPRLSQSVKSIMQRCVSVASSDDVAEATKTISLRSISPMSITPGQGKNQVSLRAPSSEQNYVHGSPYNSNRNDIDHGRSPSDNNQVHCTSPPQSCQERQLLKLASF